MVFCSGLTFLLQLIKTTLTIGLSLLIAEVVNFFNPDLDRHLLLIENGLALSFILFATQLANALCSNLVATITTICGTRLTAMLDHAIYSKGVSLSFYSRIRYPPSGIVNLITTDVVNCVEFAKSISKMVTMAIQTAVSLYFISKFMKISTLVAVGVFVGTGLIPLLLSGVISRRFEKYFEGLDNRALLLKELMGSAKFVKYESLEEVIDMGIKIGRKLQSTALTSIAFYYSIYYVVLNAQQQLTATLTIIVYTLLGNSMDPAVIFPTISFCLTLSNVSVSFISMIDVVIQFVVSYKRLSKYFAAEELESTDVIASRSIFSTTGIAIELQNASFGWESPKVEEPQSMVACSDQYQVENATHSAFKLENLNLEVKAGCLVAVVGTTASGKSTLLAAITGGLKKFSGTATSFGSIAYCPQTPWIIAGSIQENVNLYNPKANHLVDYALEVCDLKADIDLLPAGLETHVSENGANLSGGQRARLSLARAIALDADINVFDDILSALDAQVSKLVFSKAVKGLTEKKKTVVMATSLLHTLPEFDLIVVMDGGRIVQQGCYVELMKEKSGKLWKMVNGQMASSSIRPVDNASTHVPESLELASTDCEDFSEDRQMGNIKSETYLSFAQSFGIWYLIVLLIFHLANLGVGTLGQLTLSFWATKSGFGFSNENSYLYMYAGLSLGSNVLSNVMAVMVMYGCIRASNILHEKALNGLIKAPLSFLEGQPLGRVLNRMTTDVKNLDLATEGIISNIMYCSSVVLTTIIIIVVASPQMMAIIVCLLVASYSLFRFYLPAYRDLKRLASISQSPVAAHVSETMSGLSILKPHKSLDVFASLFHSRIDRANRCSFLFVHSQLWITFRIDSISCILIFSVMILGTAGIVNNDYAALAVTLGIQFSEELNFLLSEIAKLEANMVSVERLSFYASKLPQENERVLSSDAALGNWPYKGEIKIRNLQLAYPSHPNHLVIKGISFDVKAGEKVGVIGRTGSGKSTLVDAFFRLLEPKGGCILIDGQDITRVGLQKLRSSVCIVPQVATIFNGTIRSNLDPRGTGYEEANMWDALESVGLKEFVGSLEKKLDTPTLDGRLNFSAGQCQLLFIAKSLLRMPKILLMDEATSAVDPTTDQLIQNLVQKHFKHATVITIAHRLNTLSGYDKVLVLDKGMIVDFDSPRVLFSRKVIPSEKDLE
ncbi:UNVERIFIED_CONTAM: hypothetical protein HDU68_001912 [Siphonaria sp. JEL0065]|nr:hypothetical protein HDU68_001912 [Siphonaria sp. JEL0065]